MSGTKRESRPKAAVAPRAPEPTGWVCDRCHLSQPGKRIKDLWNLGWRPSDLVGPPSRRPALTCPECQARRR